jgi:hypothetical protein
VLQIDSIVTKVHYYVVIYRVLFLCGKVFDRRVWSIEKDDQYLMKGGYKFLTYVQFDK